jgi:hypothetical protein
METAAAFMLKYVLYVARTSGSVLSCCRSDPTFGKIFFLHNFLAMILKNAFIQCFAGGMLVKHN